METKSKAKKNFSVKLNPKQLKRLAVFADTELVSLGEAIRLLLDEALEARERKGQ